MTTAPATEKSEATRRRCAWLCGIIAACINTGHWPSWANKADLCRVHAWAGQIAFDAGVFSPMHAWDTEKVIKETVAALERHIQERQAANGTR